jgi:hypothetical protein
MSYETLRQFTLENCRKPHPQQSMAALLEQPTHALRATLLEPGIHGNRKPMLGCAQAVDDENSLWKEKEKKEKVDRKPRAVIGRGRPCPRKSRIVTNT